MVVDASGDEVLSLGIDDVVCGEPCDICAAYDGCYALIFDEYATYELLAFVDDGGLVYEGGHGGMVELWIMNSEL